MNSYTVGKFTFEGGAYSAEASELGWKPGEVPTEMGITHRSGVVQKFVLCGVTHGPDKDIEQFNYRSVLGHQQVHVFND